MSGIIFRREPKINLVNEPPVIGEMVFALDTGEHGWLNADGVLVWKKLDSGSSNFYDKSEVDAELALKLDAVLSYTKAEVDAELATKADDYTTYDKQEVLFKLSVKADKTQVYTKSQSDTTNDLKADKVTTYDKNEVDAALSVKANISDTYSEAAAQADLTLKADKTDTYTIAQTNTAIENATSAVTSYSKTEIDSQMDDKSDKADTYDKVEVDNKVNLKADQSTTYLKSEVDDTFNTKANASTTIDALSLKADTATTYTTTVVDTKLALKADTATVNGKADTATTYSKTEVDNSLAIKANSVDMAASLNLKENITVVDTKLALKADKTDTHTKDEVNVALGFKSDKTYVDSQDALKADQSTTYTKDEMDAALALKGDASGGYTTAQVDNLLDVKLDIADSYSKSDIDSALALKDDIANVDAKLSLKDDVTSVDTKLALKVSTSDLGTSLALKADIATTYSKNESYSQTEVAGLLLQKADQSSTYTKIEVDASLSLIDTSLESDSKLALKADKTYTYTKSESDARLALKADTTSVDNKLALKYSKIETDVLLDYKADVEAVSEFLGFKADQSTTYTKTEVDTAVAGATMADIDILNGLKNVDGSGSGLDADLLDGQSIGFYRDATNLNAGTISDARLPTTISSDITGNAATATKLSSNRTISLAGDATGSFAFDGTSNEVLTVTVVNDSHTHDGRYYTETECNTNFVSRSGDTMTGTLQITKASDDNTDFISLRSSSTDQHIALSYMHPDNSTFGVQGTLNFRHYTATVEDKVAITANVVAAEDNVFEAGTKLSSKYLGLTAKAADSDKLDNLNSATAPTVNTIPARTSSGDINARLFKSTYATQGTPSASADFCFRNTATDSDNYMRFTDRTGLLSYLGKVNDSDKLDGNDSTAFVKVADQTINIGSNTDLDTLKTPGKIWVCASTSLVATLVHKPTEVSGEIYITYQGTTQYGTQEATGGDNNNGAIFKRNYYNGTWRPWSKIWTSRNSAELVRTDSTVLQTIAGSLTVNQNFRAGTIVETSSIRYKENVEPLTNHFEILDGLEAVRYDWKESGKPDVGFIAEEVQKVLPELVAVEDGEVQGMNYSKITAVLVNIVKDQQKQIDELRELLTKK